MRAEVIGAVNILILIFRVAVMCGLIGRYQCFRRMYRMFRQEDGGSIFLRNGGIYLQIHTALARRPKYMF
jgi:hypothetical protein